MPTYAMHGFATRRALVLVLTLLAVVLPAGYTRAYGAGATAAGYAGDFPDPGVMRVGRTYYAYGTNTGGRNLPVLSSTDLKAWTSAGGAAHPVEAMAAPARWGVGVPELGGRKELWAPGVMAYRGRYVAFYALRLRSNPRRTCISVATSASPTGPFVDTTTTPVVCDSDPLGSIDPQPYVDPSSGLPYLVWKSEGQGGVSATRLWAERLDATGTRLLAGAPRRMLLQTKLAWEGPIIENPSMVSYGGQWLLFYSANDWDSPRYAVGYARCAGPAGPCTRALTRPILATAANRVGPGGASALVDAGGRLRLAYHYWPGPATGYPAHVRRLGVTALHLDRTGHLALG